MMWKFALLFLFFSIIMAPAVYFNQNGTGYALVPKPLQGYEMRTIGNLGYSSVQCQSIPVAVGKISVSCPYGTIGEFFDWGINHFTDGGEVDSCVTTSANEACKPNSDEFATVLANAVGQTEFTANINDSLFFAPSNTTDYGICTDATDLPQLFVQYSCVQSNEEMYNKYNQLAVVTAAGVLVCLLFTIMIKSLYQGGKIKRLEWDMATITAGDYTVELKIPQAKYEQWYATTFNGSEDKSNGVAPAMSLKRSMKESIEAALTEQVANEVQVTGAHTKKNADEPFNVKIADIVFAFNNYKLINALRARGKLIATQDFDAMREQELKCQELFDSPEEV